MRNRFSILYPLDTCAVCGSKNNIHIHEVFYGTANRKKSIEYGCCVGLCGEHHNLSNEGVHFNKQLDLRLKQDYQRQFEKLYSHDKYMSIFHRSYL